MKYYFCSELNTNVDFKCNEFGEEFEVLLFDYDDGVLLFPITIPFSSGRRFCAFVDTFKYPWLYNFLISNDIILFFVVFMSAYSICIFSYKTVFLHFDRLLR